jgi:hypothetical protein
MTNLSGMFNDNQNSRLTTLKITVFRKEIEQNFMDLLNYLFLIKLDLEKQMVTDEQVRRLFLESNKQKTKSLAAAKAGMNEKTARKYLKEGKFPSQLKKIRAYRTHKDVFESIWPECKMLLETNPGLEGKYLFQYFQRKYPCIYSDGQLRSFQRKTKNWRALEGPWKDVIFPQIHHPGRLGASDFTHAESLGVTIQGKLFPHLIFHFVLTYSNWETGTICFSESFESLSEGLQNALWKLGGVPERHRTDNLSAAIHKECNPDKFTQRYNGLLNHYRLKGEHINSGNANENGDVEKSHHLFKKALDQSLMLRGSRDFESREAYKKFIEKIFSQLNAGRQKRFLEECKCLRELPKRRLDDFKEETVSVRRSSVIFVGKNVYSVNSRLIGEKVKVRSYAEHIEVWYGDRKLYLFNRLRGEGKHSINYRHIIDSILRKPGAFENYHYQDSLFPTIHFRMAYDFLVEKSRTTASKEYLKILNLAAKENESLVDDILQVLFDKEAEISFESVSMLIESHRTGSLESPITKIKVDEVNLEKYDRLFLVQNTVREDNKSIQINEGMAS